MSRRVTRTATRRNAAAVNDSNDQRRGRQLSIPQMLLRHTEQLTISDQKNESIRLAGSDEGAVAGDVTCAAAGAAPTASAQQIGGFSNSKQNADSSSRRRKRKASLSVDEVRSEDSKRRPKETSITTTTTKKTGWIPIATERTEHSSEMEKPTSNEFVAPATSAFLPKATRPQTATTITTSSRRKSKSKFENINSTVLNSNPTLESKPPKSLASKPSTPSGSKNPTSSASPPRSESKEVRPVAVLEPRCPNISASLTVDSLPEDCSQVSDENRPPEGNGSGKEFDPVISVQDMENLAFISRGRLSTDSTHSLDSRRSSAESCFQFSDAQDASQPRLSSSRQRKGDKSLETSSDDSSASALLATSCVRLSQTTPVDQIEGASANKEFIPAKHSPLREIQGPRSYAPLPFQIEEKRKKFLFPVNRLCKSPLPVLAWADPEEVWLVMLQKERMYARDSEVLKKHPSLQARMRSILLDWLTEVCEVYKLHRETFYMAVDFVDRYLTQKDNIPKQLLQLIGITALFVASKIEEIYPPKLIEFAYVTDGACTEEEILQQELLMLKALSWDLSPITVNGWLNVYMQLTNVENIEDSKDKFVFPQYSGHAFSQIAQLLDLCIMDIGCLRFSHNVVATSAIYHMASEPLALSVSGLRREDILDCVEWMNPFAMALRDRGGYAGRHIPEIPEDDQHNIQMHSVDLSLLDAAQSKQLELQTLKLKALTQRSIKTQENESLAPAVSPKPSRKTDSFLTPPMSSQKHVKRT